MELKNQKGFTIIEVVLFLALSAMFLLIAFTGISGRTRDVQYTDSMRSLESFFISQRDSITKGVNTTGDGTSEDTIILGKIFQFTAGSDEVEVYTVYGRRPVSDTSETDIRKIIHKSIEDRAVSGQPIISTPEIYNMKWGLSFDRGNNTGATSPIQTTRRFGFLVDPYTNELFTVLFLDSGPSLSDPDLYDPPSDTNTYSNWYRPRLSGPPGNKEFTGLSGHYCFEDPNGQTGEIRIASGNFNLTTEAILDGSNLECL